MDITPLISIITPCYNTSSRLLRKAFESILNQTYQNWEWCIVNDGSTDQSTIKTLEDLSTHSKVKVIPLQSNSGIGIGTQIAFNHSKGDYIAFMDSDDIIYCQALEKTLDFLQKGNYDLVYTDEDRIDLNDNRVGDPHYKPDFSPHYMYSNNYICHFVMITRDMYIKAGGLRGSFDGSQDHDFLIRVINKTNNIGHLPEVLYSWRLLESYTVRPETKNKTSIRAMDALKLNMKENGYDSIWNNFPEFPFVYYHKKIVPSEPKISIVILYQAIPSNLIKCIETIKQVTTYNNYEIIVTYRSDDSIEAYKNSYLKWNESYLKYVKYEFEKFSFADFINCGVASSSNEYIILMHDTIEVTENAWIDYLLTYLVESKVGVVSGKILNKSTRTIYYAGGYISPDKKVLSYFSGKPQNSNFWNRGIAIQNTSVAFSNMMAFKKSDYCAIGGFDNLFSLYHSDVDFCLRLKKYHVYMPNCIFMYTPQNFRGLLTNSAIVAKEDDSLFQSRYYNYIDPYVNKNIYSSNTTFLEKTTFINVIEKTTTPLVTYVIPWYKDMPIAISSLLAQTYQNIEIIVCYDGIPPKSFDNIIKGLQEYGAQTISKKKIKWINTSRPHGDWGHTPREYSLQFVDTCSKFIVFSGMDNYFIPSYTDEMVKYAISTGSRAVYCDWIYNNRNWSIISSRLALGSIDCGCFMVDTAVAKQARWTDKHYEADWSFISKCISIVGFANIKKLNRTLFVHN